MSVYLAQVDHQTKLAHPILRRLGNQEGSGNVRGCLLRNWRDRAGLHVLRSKLPPCLPFDRGNAVSPVIKRGWWSEGIPKERCSPGEPRKNPRGRPKLPPNGESTARPLERKILFTLLNHAWAEGAAWGAAGLGAVLDRRFWYCSGGAPQSL